MIVVSDASPLHYLVLIRLDDLLPRLFREVIVPPAVLAELAHARAPERVRAWVNQLPPWVQTCRPQQVEPNLRLGPGETEAIALAQELRADLLLIDERRGAAIAKERGLAVIGVLGILELAAERRWIVLSNVLRDLQSTNCRISQQLIDAALARDRDRLK
ncbi:MAG: DUF3368 domain-containing protein [Phycisphaerae bacterium]|nr:DUF3368 domain-containing protein [Phycisphaerae bacterium]